MSELDVHMEAPIFGDVSSRGGNGVSLRETTRVRTTPKEWTREELAAEQLAMVERLFDGAIVVGCLAACFSLMTLGFAVMP